MEFGKHITKSLWGLADKALPVAYGIGYVYLVIRVLPEEEFGNFVLLQEIFLILSGLATALALQPMLKFASEDGEDSSSIIIVGVLFNPPFAFQVPGRTGPSVPCCMPNAALGVYIPAMLLASL
jgi:hypothetical protein